LFYQENMENMSKKSKRKEQKGKDKKEQRGNSISYGEELCGEIIAELFPYHIFVKCKPRFLKNPATGYSLELDLYSQELSVAIERNGEQHYKLSTKFHKTIEDFWSQMERDHVKHVICIQRKIKLIIIPCWFKHPADIKSEMIRQYRDTNPKIYSARKCSVCGKYEVTYDYYLNTTLKCCLPKQNLLSSNTHVSLSRDIAYFPKKAISYKSDISKKSFRRFFSWKSRTTIDTMSFDEFEENSNWKIILSCVGLLIIFFIICYLSSG
jgi:hypothetical protein